MLLVREGKYMETIEADLVTIDGDYFINILEEPQISIPISSDDPNAVKSAFNCLIERLKKGVFSISLKDADKDLFYHVAKEYLEQLNGELLDVHQEMEQYGFVEVGAQES
jgi:hypothetical protein